MATCYLLHGRSKLFSFLPSIPSCLFRVLSFVLVSMGSDPGQFITVGVAVSLWCGFAEEAEAVESWNTRCTWLCNQAV